MIATIALTAAASASASAPRVEAASRVPLHGTLEAPPVWQGSRALVLVETGRHTELRSVDTSTGAYEAVAHFPGRWDSAALSNSASLTVLEGVSIGCGGELGCKYQTHSIEREDLLVAAPGGALEPQCQHFTAECGSRDCPAFSAALVSGNVLVRQYCEGGETRTGPISFEASEVERFTGPHPSRVLVPAIAHPEALAWPWLVGLAAGWDKGGFAQSQARAELVETNLETGVVALRVSVPSRIAPTLCQSGEYPALSTVDESGRIAFLSRSGEDETLWRASPSQPAPVQIASLGEAESLQTFGCEISQPRLELRDGEVAVFSLPRSSNEHSAVRVFGLDGSALSESALSLVQGGFDFDGRSLLLGQTPCKESFLISIAPGEAAPPEPASCPRARVLRGSVRFGRRAITAAVSCPSEPALGCRWIEASVFAGPRKDMEPILAAERFASLSAGQSAHFTFPVSVRLRHYIGRHPRSRAWLRVSDATGTLLETKIRPSF